MGYQPTGIAAELVAEIRRQLETGQKQLPDHVAVIMDGNGRWAGNHGLPRIEGHRAGINSVRAVAQACRYLEIPYLTLYAFSTENWKRPKVEITALMKLLRDFLLDEIPEMQQNDIRLSSIGGKNRLPSYVQNQLEKTMKATQQGSRMQLTLALSYGSRDEIVQAVRSIAQKVSQKELDPGAVSEETISSHLYTENMPDPDLLIRTSGEMRISNFLLWQIAYAEIHVVDCLWPEFREKDFFQSMLEYLRRERRFGKVKP